MDSLSVIKEKIKELQIELNNVIEKTYCERALTKEAAVISEQLDKLIVELHNRTEKN